MDERRVVGSYGRLAWIGTNQDHSETAYYQTVDPEEELELLTLLLIVGGSDCFFLS